MGRQNLGLKAGAASCTLFCRALLCLLYLLNIVFYPFSASLPPLFLSLYILSLGSLSFLLCLFCFYLSASSFHLSLSAFLSQISLFSFLFFSSYSFLLSVPLSLCLSPHYPSDTPTPHLVSLSLLCSFSHSVNMD